MAQPETKALTKEDKPGRQKSHLMMALVQKCPACPEVGDLCKEQTREWGAAGGTYVHLSLKVEAAVLKGPVSKGRMRE